MATHSLKKRLSQYNDNFENEMNPLLRFLQIADDYLSLQAMIEDCFDSRLKVSCNFNASMNKDYQTFFTNCLDYQDEPTNCYKSSLLIVESIKSCYTENNAKSLRLYISAKSLNCQTKADFDQIKFGTVIIPVIEEAQLIKGELCTVKNEFICLKGELDKRAAKFPNNEAILQEYQSKSKRIQQLHKSEGLIQANLSRSILKELESGVNGLLKMMINFQKSLRIIYEEEIKSIEKEVMIFDKGLKTWNETKYIESDSIEVKYLESKEESAVIEFDEMALSQFNSTIALINTSSDTEENSRKLDKLCGDLIKFTSDLQRYSDYFSNTIQIKKVLFSMLEIFMLDLINNFELFKKDLELNCTMEASFLAFIGPQAERIWKTFLNNKNFIDQVYLQKQKFCNLINVLKEIKKKLESETDRKSVV